MKKKTLKQTLSMIVVLILLLGILPVNAWAEDHVHDAACGYAPASACTHSHDDTCGYAEADEAHPCTHTHDAACGYSEGSACNYGVAPIEESEHTCDWGEWTFNKDGTHTRVCKTDSTHIENGSCAELEWTYDSNGHSGRWLCNVCNGGLDKNSADYPEHIYSGDTDLTCDTCGYVRSVEGSLSITGDLPAATVGVAYSADFSYTGEVSGVVFWNATGLPAGLTVDYGTGTISGTPTTAGTYEVTVSMGATGGGSAEKSFTLTVNAEHTHVWSTEWSDNDSYHWHECIADGCDLIQSWGEGKGDYAKHEFDITRDTHSYIDNIGFGYHYGTCKLCGRSDSRIIIAATLQFDDTHHWYECPCSVIGWMAGPEKAEHRFDDDADTTCDDCGYERTVAGHTHVWSDQWSGNEWAHWHDCTADGCDLPANLGENKEGFGYHEFDFAGSTHVPQGGSTNAIHKGTCLICGETEALKNFNEGTLKSDDTHHWYEYLCGSTLGREKQEHSFDGDADTTCNDCGYDRTVSGGTTVNGVITLTPADLVDGASGEGWSFAENILTISRGYTLKFEGTCGTRVDNYGTIESGTFSGDVNNYGAIEGGTFSGKVNNYGTIENGSFDCSVYNSDIGTISGGTFSSDVNSDGTITDGNFSSNVNNYGTITDGNFSGSVTNSPNATISGGVFTGGMGNYGTVTGTADLSNLHSLRDHDGQYGKDVKLPKAVMKGDLTYIDCDSSTEITLHYYADGVKTAEWTVSGDKYSYPVEGWKRTDPAAELSAIEGISHEVKAVPMDGYEITIDNPIWDRFHVTVTALHTHSYGTEWKSDGTNHWHECSCGAKSGEAAHSGGTATCTEKAKCTVCGTEYGNLAEHTYSTEWKSDGTNHWHECSCGAKKDVAAHSGGTATCTEKAKCSLCGNSYGEKDSDNHSFTKYVSDENATCKRNGTETAKCDHGCGKTDTRTDLGSKLGHNFVNGVCTRCKVSQWNPDTGDKIMIAVTLLALSGTALLLLLVFRKKQRR